MHSSNRGVKLRLTLLDYRDSKLTRILADSLGGDANTALIATVGPAPQNQVLMERKSEHGTMFVHGVEGRSLQGTYGHVRAMVTATATVRVRVVLVRGDAVRFTWECSAP